ncbi:hypothetical protein M422DRAFT_775509 [Sphaerobolus stellatus SS14]|nr:hypothetical protein M422DRAFT_775509 [Sphaerobolus stellatus SS14]
MSDLEMGEFDTPSTHEASTPCSLTTMNFLFKRLPQHLSRNIIALIDDLSDLFSFSLSCRKYFTQIRNLNLIPSRLLYCQIGSPPSLLTLCNSLNPDYYCSNIHTLHLFNPFSSPSSFPVTPIIGVPDMVQQGAQLHILDGFLRLFASFSSLKVFHITDNPFTHVATPPAYLPSNLERVLSQLAQDCPTLNTLTIWHGCHMPLLTRIMPPLMSLNVTHVSISLISTDRAFPDTKYFIPQLLIRYCPLIKRLELAVPEDDVVQLEEVLTGTWPHLSHLTINQRSASSQLDKPRTASAIRLFLDEHDKITHLFIRLSLLTLSSIISTKAFQRMLSLGIYVDDALRIPQSLEQNFLSIQTRHLVIVCSPAVCQLLPRFCLLESLFCTVSAAELHYLLKSTPVSVTRLHLNIIDGTQWNKNAVWWSIQESLEYFKKHTQIEELSGVFDRCLLQNNKSFGPFTALAKVLPALKRTTGLKHGHVGWFEVKRNPKTIKPVSIRYRRTLYDSGGFYAPYARTVEAFLY